MFGKHTIRLFLFGTLFLASLFSLLYYALPRGLDPTAETPLNGIQGLDDEDRQPIKEGEVDYGTVISVITAVITGLGFIFTTFFAFREDRRATELHRLEIENAKRELAQKELEIEELRQRLRRGGS
ncbi:MAG: hypothetical protein AAF614_09400 [Chloroflexota bacterium]